MYRKTHVTGNGSPLTRSLTILALLAAFCLPTFSAVAQAPVEGKVVGRVFDAQNGEPLLGATVMIEGSKLGAMTDLDGNFIIKHVPPGTYVVVASMVGYAQTRVTEVAVAANENTRLELALRPQLIQMKGITVEAKRLKNNEASMLRERQLSSSVSDAISAESMARAGAGDAAQAMSHVTGASTDGKYVFIRGLGERYSNTRINGSLAPSADPDKQAVNMDIIPAGLLDNIVVEKTFTPDKAGNFSGGSIDLRTKDLPEGRVISFSTSTSYNSNTTGKDDVLAYVGGSKDWIAMGSDSREAPSYLEDPVYSTPDPTRAFRDTALALQLDKDSKAINTPMQPTKRTAPLNQAYAFTYGDTWNLFTRPLGISASFNYSRNHSYYEGGQLGQWTPLTIPGQGTVLDSLYQYRDAVGKDEVLWGGLLNTAYYLGDNHKVNFTYLYNRSGESTARYVEGWNYNLGTGAAFRTRNLLYSERQLSSGQLRGTHAGLLGGLKVEWQLTDSKSLQDEPDLRFFSDNATAIEGTSDSSYGIYQVYPAHYFRYTSERNREGQLDLTVPFKQWSGLAAKVQVGGSFLHKTRSFNERQFIMNTPRVNTANNQSYDGTYNGNPNDWLADGNIGIAPDTSITDRWVDLAVTWSAFSDPNGNYSATQDVIGIYGMFDIPLTSKLQLVTGLRHETTEMSLDQTYRANDTTKLMDGSDYLPAVTLNYRFTEQLGIRAAYGRTLARPSFRELAPYSTWEFVGGSFASGYRSLKYTKIDNFDLRWEWYPRSGEILAVSVFYKKFHDPIERVILNTNYDISWRNSDRGEVRGLELEFRSKLDFVWQKLSDFRIGGNLSLIRSEVKLTDQELTAIRNIDPGAKDTRQLQGQSPYLLNLDFGYEHEKTGTALSLLYNRFGKRLSEVSLWANPSIYELPRSTVNATLSQRIWRGISFKAGVKNLTDSDIQKVYQFQGRDYTAQRYNTGRTVSIGMSYQF